MALTFQSQLIFSGSHSLVAQALVTQVRGPGFDSQWLRFYFSFSYIHLIPPNRNLRSQVLFPTKCLNSALNNFTQRHCKYIKSKMWLVQEWLSLWLSVGGSDTGSHLDCIAGKSMGVWSTCISGSFRIGLPFCKCGDSNAAGFRLIPLTNSIVLWEQSC